MAPPPSPPTPDPSQASQITPIGYLFSSCGYCSHKAGKSDYADYADSPEPAEPAEFAESVESPERETSSSYFAIAHQLAVADYQDLMAAGWRRSGDALYLPDPAWSCCPHYTIRSEAAAFDPPREYRQALHRWNRLVLGSAYERDLSRQESAGKPKSSNPPFDLLHTVARAQSNNLPARTTGPRPDHNFTVTLEPATFTAEKYHVYRRYQLAVHNDPPEKASPATFERFLCKSPLFTPPAPPPRQDEPPKELGSFHMCYRLDGALVAVSVLDLLPDAVSAVYLFYDPSHPALLPGQGNQPQSFGKVSTMHEIALAVSSGYSYYYMGYTIWTCPKMRYKARVRPQLILDWHTRAWLSLEDAAVTSRLDAAGARLARLSESAPTATTTDQPLSNQDPRRLRDRTMLKALVDAQIPLFRLPCFAGSPSATATAAAIAPTAAATALFSRLTIYPRRTLLAPSVLDPAATVAAADDDGGDGCPPPVYTTAMQMRPDLGAGFPLNRASGWLDSDDFGPGQAPPRASLRIEGGRIRLGEPRLPDEPAARCGDGEHGLARTFLEEGSLNAVVGELLSLLGPDVAARVGTGEVVLVF